MPAAASAFHHAAEVAAWEALMAKGQMRAPKEKKKPKADKHKPKQPSPYKQAQMSASSSSLNAPKKG